MGRAFWMPLAGVFALALAGGCTRYTDLNKGFSKIASRSMPERLKVINGTYKLGPPDVIEIRVQDNPDLSTSVIVRPDGCITFSPLGDLYVEGMTPEKISAELNKRLEERIRDVETTVTVVGFNSKKIYVNGEVNAPGPQPFTGDMTIAEALANARFVTVRAAPGSVRLVRGGRENRKLFKINLNEIIRKGDADMDLMLQEGDHIYVPANAFAKVGYAIDAVLWPFRSLLSAAFSVVAVQNVQ
jgi:polysaccharide export outer membrane protein